ncbi:hypothetical protein QM201_20080 [Enterobacter asburiae]|nr:hypothetical protein [Enterobacter asburiae]
MYDDSGLLTGRTSCHAEYRYMHDLNGLGTCIRRTPTAEGVAPGIEGDEIVFTHDAAGHLVSESDVNRELSYAWDARGNLTNMALSGGQQLSWLHYDPQAGRLRFRTRLGLRVET